MNQRHRFSTRPPARRAGFTLVELLISIALVLILILGINQIFGLTSKTVSAGQAFSAINRDARATPNVLYGDARGIALEAPFFIRSGRVPAFRNREDRDADLDGDALTFDPYRSGPDSVRFGTGNNEIPLWTYNDRNHRVDVTAFFARGKFTKQTGKGATLVDTDSGYPVVSNEAWVWYGHLRLPSPITGADYQYPGAGTNQHDNAALTSNWYLGRAAMLLNADPPNALGFVKPKNPDQKNVFSPAGSDPPIDDSQYDMVQTSISDFNGFFSRAVAANNYQYWNDMGPWRFIGNPAPPRPLDSLGVARTVPCYLRACTQFIVEYAGDFTTQNAANGDVQPSGTTLDPATNTYKPYSSPDGVTDFDVDGTGATALRKIRWYGFPRQVTNNDKLGVHDVIPLADHLAKVGIQQASFERHVPQGGPEYNNLAPNDEYIVAWGSDIADAQRPTMLRFTVVLDDPGSRLAAAQTFEYVVKLK